MNAAATLRSESMRYFACLRRALPCPRSEL